ncbi:MAG: HlyD family type I secretion periplasmic adaptor subunit [Lentisphaeria bacterium]|nr:HlyD family type I secretion periplasmic adaptor subunit [Lentisphaeria bacterium]
MPEQIVESQPDALEIRNQALPRYIRFCVWFPFLTVCIAAVWACLAKTDVIVQGGGKLVTNRPTIVMKPLERSVIKEIHVRIGDMVKTGQILITFDPEINKAEADRLKNEIVALEAQLSRLQAEFQDKPYTGNQEQFSRWQLAIFRQRQEFYKEKLNYYREAEKQLDASVKRNKDSLIKQRERLESMKRLEEMFRSLHEKKAASLKDLIQMSLSRMEMESAVDQLNNSLLELEHRKGTLTAEKNSFVQEWRNTISEEMVKVDRNLASIRKEYDKQARLLEYVHLRAPCNAIVHEVAPFSPGSAVREAESLITLVPLEGDIELEAELRPEDIGKVKVGAKAKIKLTAWPFQKHGTLDGMVRNISEDTLEKNVSGVPMKYYRARVTVSGRLKGVKNDFRLIPGMETQCEIKCGRRRVIEYVLYPLIKALDETAREP